VFVNLEGFRPLGKDNPKANCLRKIATQQNPIWASGKKAIKYTANWWAFSMDTFGFSLSSL